MSGLATTLLGALLCGLSWYFAWSDLGLVSRYSFFPLWLGYIVLVNGIAELVFADSLFRRLGGNFPWLFVLSVPFWWFFEFLNVFVQNWHYVFAAPISTLHFAIEASVDFSTVVPAVLSTGFLIYRGLQAARLSPGKKRAFADARIMRRMCVIGILCFILVWLAPTEAFPLVWIAPFLIIEPLSYLKGYPSLLGEFSQGRWLLPASAMTATLLTGFWWECWNFYSLPKWVYTVPYVGFCKIFEMPVLGYFAYPFFGLIVFGYTILAVFLCFGENAALTKSIAIAFDLESDPSADERS